MGEEGVKIKRKSGIFPSMENIPLFNSSGEWIALKKGPYLYNNKLDWVGYFPWNDNEAVTRGGKYLGEIFPGNRFYHVLLKPYREVVVKMDFPGYPGTVRVPEFIGYSPLPKDTVDIRFTE